LDAIVRPFQSAVAIDRGPFGVRAGMVSHRSFNWRLTLFTQVVPALLAVNITPLPRGLELQFGIRY
jgi:hypothetical protein